MVYMEFMKKELHSLLDSLGIVHQTTCVYTPQKKKKKKKWGGRKET